MEKKVIYSVRVIDPATYRPFPGVEEIRARYQAWQASRTSFAFPFGSPEAQQAAADLRHAGLSFHTACEIALTPDEERTHPVFWLNAPGYYEVIDLTTDPPRVKAKELAGGMVCDVGQELHALTPEMVNGLAGFGVQLTTRLAQTTKRKPAWLVEQFPALPDPYEVLGATAVTENTGEYAGTFSPKNWDTRVHIPASSLAYLQRHHLGAGAVFRYQDQVYRSHSAVHLVSGTLAQWLRQTSGNLLQLTPAVLDTVWNA
jgi:hypothetical protein